MGFQIPFNIDRVVIDIDCGILYPDLGDGHFYVNEVSLKSQSFTSAGSHFRWQMQFEDAGREIKGYHNKFGDGLDARLQPDPQSYRLHGGAAGSGRTIGDDVRRFALGCRHHFHRRLQARGNRFNFGGGPLARSRRDLDRPLLPGEWLFQTEVP